MVIFRTPLDALDFVLELEKETGDPQIRIRAGIHVGQARVIDDDIFGIMVNYSKRVEGTDCGPVATKLSDAAKNQIADEKAERHSRLSFHPLDVEFKEFTERREFGLFLPLGMCSGSVPKL